ncbi:MAG: hypothetical protein H0T51_12975 [Pirellulales bacterium]|nr:hypothetical protein [Pirellulales bacterium]
MLRETEPFALGTSPTPFRPGPMDLARAMTPADATLDLETAEQEIARLTWTVLDGSASLTDRQRLAALVNAQHIRRLRIDTP